MLDGSQTNLKISKNAYLITGIRSLYSSFQSVLDISVQLVGASTEWNRTVDSSALDWWRITKPYIYIILSGSNIMTTCGSSRSDIKPSHPSQYADSEYCITENVRGPRAII